MKCSLTENQRFETVSVKWRTVTATLFTSVSTKDLQANLRHFLITLVSGDTITRWTSRVQHKSWLAGSIGAWDLSLIRAGFGSLKICKIENLRQTVGNLTISDPRLREVTMVSNSAFSLTNICSYRKHKQVFQTLVCRGVNVVS